MYAPKCPFCGCSKSVKCGLPRRRCGSCRRTFRVRQKKRRLRAVVESYVGDGTSYARLALRWGVSRSTAYRRLARALDGRAAPLDRTRRILGGCDGVCVLDGKHLRVGGLPFTIYVAWDRGVGVPIHAVVLAGGESDLGYWKLLTGLRHAGYAAKAFVSDGYPALMSFVAANFPDLPHQRCVVHAFMWVRSVVAPGKRSGWRKDAFVELARQVLWSDGLGEARLRLEAIAGVKGLGPKERRAVGIMRNALADTFTAGDPRWLHLNLPRSSNAIENVMGQIEARLKTRRGAKSFAASKSLVNEILLRVKRQVINQ